MVEPRTVTFLAAALATLLLGACTPTRWERDGYELDTNGTDWKDCRSQSIGNANRWYFEPYPRTFIGRGSRGRAFSYYRASPYPNRFMLEQDYLDNCLRARGFQRVPVPAANEQTPAPAGPASYEYE